MNSIDNYNPIMLAANLIEFQTGLNNYLDKVEDNNETIIIRRKQGKGAVLLSLSEYNSIMETLHLLSSKRNASYLYDSIQQMNTGKIVVRNLIEE